MHSDIATGTCRQAMHPTCFTPLADAPHEPTGAFYVPESHNGLPDPFLFFPTYKSAGDVAIIDSRWIHRGGARRTPVAFVSFGMKQWNLENTGPIQVYVTGDGLPRTAIGVHVGLVDAGSYFLGCSFCCTSRSRGGVVGTWVLTNDLLLRLGMLIFPGLMALFLSGVCM